jgi:hypothetical protein
MVSVIIRIFSIIIFIFEKQNLILSVFRPRGVPGPTSKSSPRVPAQMGRREMEHEGGQKRGRQT